MDKSKLFNLNFYLENLSISLKLDRLFEEHRYDSVLS
jgi:hypothetical protein